MKKYGLFVYAETGMTGPSGQETDTEHLDMDHYSNDLENLIEIAEGIIKELKTFGDGKFSLEIWKRPKDGMWGNTGEPIWQKEIISHNKIKESKEGAKMLIEKKKVPPMMKRFKNKKKKVKEDFENEHGIEMEEDDVEPIENTDESIEIEDEPIENVEEPIEETTETSDDLIANLIAGADDATLEALLVVIEDELSSRGESQIDEVEEDGEIEDETL